MVLWENCTKEWRERVLSVPGDVAMLNSIPVSPKDFNVTAVPYNITWYNLTTGQEISNQTGRILVNGETLWILKVMLGDAGEYETILRTPFQCYRQVTKLIVDLPVPGECGRPQRADQILTRGVTDNLACPLKNDIKKLKSYNITPSVKWYRGCDLIVDGTDRYSFIDATTLKIDKVELRDNGSYTCNLDVHSRWRHGIDIRDHRCPGKYSLVPQIREPANETLKEQMGSNFTKRCLVFVECVGVPKASIVWMAGDKEIQKFKIPLAPCLLTKKTVSTLTFPFILFHLLLLIFLRRDAYHNGAWLERLLVFSNLNEEDFHINYTCHAFNSMGVHKGYFTLLPADPNVILPIGLVFGSVTVLFIISVIVYYVFKVDIVLWFRRAFPVLYTNKGSDGKLHDAYVAYPQPSDDGFSKEVEAFALHTLPEVLEKACGYKLFIAGRDCLPGGAVVDSVEENIQASRRILLLYTASTFTSGKPTSGTIGDNKKICSDNTQSKTESGDGSSGVNFDGSDGVYPDTRQQLECVTAMHRALLEGSLKVVLVELEEITPAQLALLPESVRHLRKKQGAVCWWKNQRTKQRWKSYTRRREDEEKDGQRTQLSASLSPSSRNFSTQSFLSTTRTMAAAGWVFLAAELLSLTFTLAHDHHMDTETFHVSVGKLFLLRCPIADAHTEVTWSRGNNVSLPTGVEVRDGMLWFLPVQDFHHGSYTCKKRDKTELPGIKLGVSVSSEECPDSSETVSINQGVTDGLYCKQKEILGLNNTRNIRWMKDCHPVERQGEPIDVEDDGFMRLPAASGRDAGEYTCLIDISLDGRKVHGCTQHPADY
ncbi:hypothetical protein L3Q82_004303 [Scortum barcoo]|uniref:Uncharacterized protein n=1 Tax=Scortum barcoo TaxID=214431 RepID=A0ACB8VJ74_9TELE|nr:hypothetical protein L3Q82_004303 [Scortum barcoo]